MNDRTNSNGPPHRIILVSIPFCLFPATNESLDKELAFGATLGTLPGAQTIATSCHRGTAFGTDVFSNDFGFNGHETSYPLRPYHISLQDVKQLFVVI
ncbi:MAG: hypothetical protein OK457_06725 [Thaumarchaeota archaeon]|nr:hypothetical protein [Nitrososphaerota archaeon]